VIVEVEVGIEEAGEGAKDGDIAFDVGFTEAGLVDGARVVEIVEVEEVGIEEREEGEKGGDTKVG